MDRERRLVMVAVAAVVAAAAATFFFTPSQTTLQIPEPGQRGNGTSPGVQVLAENLEVPWAIDVAEDGRVFFTERPGTIRVIENGTLLQDPVAFINVEQNG